MLWYFFDKCVVSELLNTRNLGLRDSAKTSKTSLSNFTFLVVKPTHTIKDNTSANESVLAIRIYVFLIFPAQRPVFLEKVLYM